MNNIILIAPPLSGKTTIGKYLAKHLGYNFFDSDEILNKNISLSLAIKDPEKFREEETKVYHSNFKEPFVLSTGGGIVLNSENFKTLNGIIIYLKVDTETLEYRNKKTPHQMYKKGVKSLLNERLVLYEKYANIIYNADIKLEIYPLILDLEKAIKDYEKKNINN